MQVSDHKSGLSCLRLNFDVAAGKAQICLKVTDDVLATVRNNTAGDKAIYESLADKIKVGDGACYDDERVSVSGFLPAISVHDNEGNLLEERSINRNQLVREFSAERQQRLLSDISMPFMLSSLSELTNRVNESFKRTGAPPKPSFSVWNLAEAAGGCPRAPV